MKLNNIAEKPFKVISYILLTFIGSYLTTMSFNVAFTTTLICTWICMMPRLEFEKFSFKDKIPKVFIKFDIPNNLLKIVPIAMGLVFCVQESSGSPLIYNSNLNIIIYLLPLIVGCLHYFIYNKYKNEQDWAMPFFVSILIVLGSQFVVGDFGDFIKNIFPQFIENSVPNIYLSWLLLLQIAIVYGIYRLLSIIIASRYICITILGILFTIFAYMQNIYHSVLSLDFKPNDMLKIKEFIALMSILHKDNMDTVKIISALAVIIIIGAFACGLSKKASVYSFKIRAKSFVCGGIVILITFLCLNTVYKNVTFDQYRTDYGFVSYIVHNLNQKNTFSEKLQKEIQAEVIAMEQAAQEKEETQSKEEEDPYADFTVPPATEPTQAPVQQQNPHADYTVPPAPEPTQAPIQQDPHADFTVPPAPEPTQAPAQPQQNPHADFTIS